MATTQAQIDKKAATVEEKRAKLRSLETQREQAAATASMDHRKAELDAEDAALTAQIKRAEASLKAQKGAELAVDPESAVVTTATDTDVKAKTKADAEDSTSGTVRNQ